MEEELRLLVELERGFVVRDVSVDVLDKRTTPEGDEGASPPPLPSREGERERALPEENRRQYAR